MTSPSTRNLDARGVDRAQELLARYYEPYDITPLGDADDFHLRIRSVDVGSLSLVNVRYGSVVHIAATQRLQDAYCVSQVCAGGLQLSSGHDAVDLRLSIEHLLECRRLSPPQEPGLAEHLPWPALLWCPKLESAGAAVVNTSTRLGYRDFALYLRERAAEHSAWDEP